MGWCLMCDWCIIHQIARLLNCHGTKHGYNTWTIVSGKITFSLPYHCLFLFIVFATIKMSIYLWLLCLSQLACSPQLMDLSCLLHRLLQLPIQMMTRAVCARMLSPDVGTRQSTQRSKRNYSLPIKILSDPLRSRLIVASLISVYYYQLWRFVLFWFLSFVSTERILIKNVV